MECAEYQKRLMEETEKSKLHLSPFIIHPFVQETTSWEDPPSSSVVHLICFYIILVLVIY